MILVLAVLYAGATVVLFVFGLNQLWLSALHTKQGGLRKSPSVRGPKTWPHVIVQLPLYNERRVAKRLIDCVAHLDYPAECLEIQVLDDSTDNTRNLVATTVEYWQSRGVRIDHITRDCRTGYKAGALSNGLRQTEGEFVAVFDADFLPDPGFLKETIPVILTDPDIGMVQARWGHTNDDQSLLTRVQAALLDTHFVVEQDVRDANGFFLNFNGTAGVWRTSCIKEAGGWHSDTLTEDLDLSYRAQLNGWKFRYLADVAVPAEIPDTVAAWRQQQFRWTKGAVECAQKLLRDVWKAPIRIGVKVQATLHLTGFAVFPAILLAVFLHAPLLVAHSISVGPGNLYFGFMSIGILAFFGVVLAHVLAQRALYSEWKKRVVFEPALLAASLGLCVNNTRGVIEAIAKKRSPFQRTPKVGFPVIADQEVYKLDSAFSVVWLERLLAMYSLVGLGALFAVGAWAGIGFQLMFVLGFGLLGWHDQIADRLDRRRQSILSGTSVTSTHTRSSVTGTHSVA